VGNTLPYVSVAPNKRCEWQARRSSIELKRFILEAADSDDVRRHTLILQKPANRTHACAVGGNDEMVIRIHHPLELTQLQAEIFASDHLVLPQANHDQTALSSPRELKQLRMLHDACEID